MASLPKPTEKQIRDWVGERSFTRGEEYFRGGAIFQPRRQHSSLEARCEGSGEEAYRVEVTFQGERLKESSCSCPVGGHCKHVAALLLAWRARPEAFQEKADLWTALERRSKSELI